MASNCGQFRFLVKEGSALPLQQSREYGHTHLVVEVGLAASVHLTHPVELENASWNETFGFPLEVDQELAVRVLSTKLDSGGNSIEDGRHCIGHHSIEIDQLPADMDVEVNIPLDPEGWLGAALTTIAPSGDPTPRMSHCASDQVPRQSAEPGNSLMEAANTKPEVPRQSAESGSLIEAANTKPEVPRQSAESGSLMEAANTKPEVPCQSAESGSLMEAANTEPEAFQTPPKSNKTLPGGHALTDSATKAQELLDLLDEEDETSGRISIGSSAGSSKSDFAVNRSLRRIKAKAESKARLKAGLPANNTFEEQLSRNPEPHPTVQTGPVLPAIADSSATPTPSASMNAHSSANPTPSASASTKTPSASSFKPSQRVVPLNTEDLPTPHSHGSVNISMAQPVGNVVGNLLLRHYNELCEAVLASGNSGMASSSNPGTMWNELNPSVDMSGSLPAAYIPPARPQLFANRSALALDTAPDPVRPDPRMSNAINFSLAPPLQRSKALTVGSWMDSSYYSSPPLPMGMAQGPPQAERASRLRQKLNRVAYDAGQMMDESNGNGFYENRQRVNGRSEAYLAQPWHHVNPDRIRYEQALQSRIEDLVSEASIARPGPDMVLHPMDSNAYYPRAQNVDWMPQQMYPLYWR